MHRIPDINIKDSPYSYQFLSFSVHEEDTHTHTHTRTHTHTHEHAHTRTRTRTRTHTLDPDDKNSCMLVPKSFPSYHYYTQAGSDASFFAMRIQFSSIPICQTSPVGKYVRIQHNINSLFSFSIHSLLTHCRSYAVVPCTLSVRQYRTMAPPEANDAAKLSLQVSC